MLLSWNTAACMVVCLVGVSALLRPARSERVRAVWAVTWEAAIVLALYALWQRAGEVAVTHVSGAADHALWVWRAERRLHFPSELSVQHLVLPHPALVQALNGFYAVVHVPALIVFLLWMFLRHRPAYRRWRNVGAVLTAACLAIQLLPVAPPRLLPQLGFVDTALRYGESVYAPGGIGNATQLAAMPSVHVAWAVFVAVAVIAVSRSSWRWWILAHPCLTLFAVVATGNHWWLDGVVGAALLPAAMGVEAAARAVAVRVRVRVRSAGLVPVPAGAALADGSGLRD